MALTLTTDERTELERRVRSLRGTAGENNACSISGLTHNAISEKRRYASASWREN
jgi:hypothetical protein